MPMREDCTFYESRTYASGDVARFCTIDMAPEAPWRCPTDCPKYERILFIETGFERGSLAPPPRVAEVPGAHSDDIAAVLDAAEDIVNAAGPSVLDELAAESQRRPWWKRLGRGRRKGDGGDTGRPPLSRR